MSCEERTCLRAAVRGLLVAGLLLAAVGPSQALADTPAADAPLAQDAITRLRQEASAHPDDAWSQLRLARAIHETEGPTSEALEHFEIAVKLAPDLKEAHHFYGVALLDADRREEAEKQLAKALELDPGDQTVRLRWARVLQRMGQTDRSISELQKLLAAEPGNAKALIAIASAHAAAGDATAAIAAYEKVLTSDAADSSELTLAHLELAQLRSLQGELAQAIAHDRAVLAARPRYLQSQRRLAETSVRLAAERATDPARPADLRSALEPLEAALDVVTEPTPRSRLLFNRAVLLQQLGNESEAVRLYKEALELDPEYHDAHFNLGFTFGKSGQIDNAIHHFKRAIETQRGDGAAYAALATAYNDGKRYAEAHRALLDGIAQVPADARLQLALARFLTSCPDASLHDPAAALAAAEKAVQTHPTAESVETYAELLATNGRFTDAASWQQRLLAEAEKAGAPAPILDKLRRNLARYQGNQPAL